MGLVFAAELVPIAVLGIPAGAIVQKLGPKASMLSRTEPALPIIAAVPFLHATGTLSFGLILVLAALFGLFSTAPTSPASG